MIALLPRPLLAIGLSVVAILSVLGPTSNVSADSWDNRIAYGTGEEYSDCGAAPEPYSIINSAIDQIDSEATASIMVGTGKKCATDLVVSKEVTPDGLLHPGDVLTYTITYFNNGPRRASHVAVVDFLPAGIRLTGSDSDPDREPPTGSGHIWTWRIGTLGVGKGGVITLHAMVDTSVEWGELTTVTNWAAIVAATRDSDWSNNFDSVTQQVVQCDVPAVRLVPVPDTTTPNGTSLVTATVTDCSGNPVQNGTLITFTADSLGTFVTEQPRTTANGVATSTFQAGPLAGVSIVTGTTTSASGTASITITPDTAHALTLRADPLSQVVGGSSALTATVTDQYGNLINSATVTFMTDLGSVLSPRTTTNGVATSQISSTVAGIAHITATSGAAQGTAAVTFTPGAANSLTLEANPILLAADGVSTSVITATVVDQFGNPVADGTEMSFSAILGSVTTPHLTTNGHATATFTAGNLTGTAIVTATANGQSSSIDLTLTATMVDLSSSVKIASADVITRVEQLSYTITLTNSGNSVAASVTVTDPIPLGTDFVPGSLTGSATYNPSLYQIEWNGSVPAGGSVSFSHAVTVTVIENRTVVNRAYVSLDGVLDRILTAETRIIPAPSPPTYRFFLPLIMRDSS